jgi:hypothetical protein
MDSVQKAKFDFEDGQNYELMGVREEDRNLESEVLVNMETLSEGDMKTFRELSKNYGKAFEEGEKELENRRKLNKKMGSIYEKFHSETNPILKNRIVGTFRKSEQKMKKLESKLKRCENKEHHTKFPLNEFLLKLVNEDKFPMSDEMVEVLVEEISSYKERFQSPQTIH